MTQLNMENEIYAHRQTSHLFLVFDIIIFFGLLVFLISKESVGNQKILAAISIYAVLGILVLLFSSLTVTINDTEIKTAFTLRIIRKTFKLKDIASAEIVKNPWYYGWGIRLTPKGWMFNVSGFDAVELSFLNGKRFRIGTDEPEQLLAAINSKLSARRNY